MVDIESVAAKIRWGKKDRKKKTETTGQKYNGLPYYIGQAIIRKNKKDIIRKNKRQRNHKWCTVFSSLILLLNATRMWANAQRDGCPAEYRWRPVLNAEKFGRTHCSTAVQ